MSAAQPVLPPVAQASLLLVEDQDQVRNLLSVLTDAGYMVRAAADGPEALELLAGATEQPVDLLLTDVSMPHMSGPQLAQHLCERYPGLAVIYMSGYVPDGLQGMGDYDHVFLQKPFTLQEMLDTIRQTLTAPVRVA